MTLLLSILSRARLEIPQKTTNLHDVILILVYTSNYKMSLKLEPRFFQLKNKRKSGFQIESIADHILRLKGQKVPMVVVGNKSDLSPSQRVVPASEGKALAQRLHCDFYESSAKLNENVSEVFFDVLRQIRQAGGGGKVGEKKDRRGCCTVL